MHPLRLVTAATAFALCLAPAAGALASEKGVKLPKDFREWTHTKSMVIPDKSHGLYGFHNIYANEKAVKTLKAGGTYKEEAAFVVSFYEVVDKDGMVSQGKKLMDVLMEKDKKAEKTGGWVWAAFDADGKAKAIDPVKDCYECHVPVAEKDYVFHSYVE